jgi:hypothetical protein
MKEQGQIIIETSNEFCNALRSLERYIIKSYMTPVSGDTPLVTPPINNNDFYMERRAFKRIPSYVSAIE